MKKIEAIIRKSRFEDVKEALLAADIDNDGVTDLHIADCKNLRQCNGVRVLLPSVFVNGEGISLRRRCPEAHETVLVHLEFIP